MKILLNVCGGLNSDPYPSSDDFCALIAFSRSKSYFFSIMKFFPAASSVRSKNKFWWCRRWDCLVLDLVDDFCELDRESSLTGVRYAVGSPVCVVALSLVA